MPDYRQIILAALLGLCVVVFIRAKQIWSYRQMYGYTVYKADRLRSNLARLGLVGTAVFAGGAVFYLWGQAQPTNQPVISPLSLETSPDTTAEPLPMELYIPSIGLHTAIIEAPFAGREWDISRLAGEVAHLQGTAYPDQQNNMVLAGHVTIPNAGWGPFQGLESLALGDRVFVGWGSVLYTYEIIEQQVVTPNNVEMTFPTGDARLTLITCANWDETVETYTHRTIVIAQLIAVEDT